MIGILSKKNNIQQVASDEDIASIVDSYEFTKFQVYDVAISHPKSWHIFVNPSKPFDYYDGQVKIDHSMDKSSKDNEFSLSLRWARIEKDITIDEYVNEIQKQYLLKQKKNKRDLYKILSINEDSCDGGTKSYLIKSEVKANHSIYRILKNDESFRSSELVTYNPNSKRIAFAVMTSRSEIFDEYQFLFNRILRSLNCQ